MGRCTIITERGGTEEVSVRVGEVGVLHTKDVDEKDHQSFQHLDRSFQRSKLVKSFLRCWLLIREVYLG